VDPARARALSALRLRTLVLLACFGMFGPLSMDLYLPALPQLARTLGTTDALAQASMSVCMIGLGAGQLITGPLSDRIGRRVTVLAGLGAFALLSAACALAPTIEALLVLRLLQGVAGSTGMVVATAIVRDRATGGELSRGLALMSMLSGAAPILAPVVGGRLALIMDWRGIFGVLAGIGAIVFVVAAAALRESLPVERRHGGGFAEARRHLRALRTDRSFVGLLLVSAFVGIMFFSYLSMSSFVLQDGYGTSPQLFSLLFAANAVAAMAGSQTSRVLVRRAGSRALYLIAVTGAAAACLVLLALVLLGAGLPPVAATLAVVLFFEGIGLPNSSALALDAHSERAGTAAAALGTAGLVIGPVVAPLVSIGGVSAAVMAGTMAVSALIAVTLVWVLVRRPATMGVTDRI
jgi:DHA1 family bicyclomycin/chloramphenicol resistance-like MFS transporter